ncbi:hypothetical protein FNV43_RR24238 [Rhamnella rubrinervis]|uniref:Uncharacterized protein n=1 Tax=Rhamnella rubrinervis TaxID=2594499 RepID=A0A8K0GQ24_9ROSA|nr:hypothetical protein FNV43_RR24238 [Rhamnella rubrinervis]
MRKVSEHDSPIWYDDQVSFMPDLESPKHNSHSNNLAYHIPFPCKKELDLPYQVPHEHFLQLPLLDSPKLVQSASIPMAAYSLDINHGASNFYSSSLTQEDHQIQRSGHDQNFRAVYGNSSNHEQATVDQLTDWRVLDKFVASQLSHGNHVSKENNSYSNSASNMFNGSSNSTNVVVRHLEKQEMVPENASMSTSTCQIELWK